MKQNKIWVDKGREFCNRSIKFWFEDMKESVRNASNT